MSVRKSCSNCKHNKMGICHFGNVVGGRVCKTRGMEYWELTDDAKVDLLHDAAPEHDIPKYKSCKRYINGSCYNARIFADKPGIKFDCSKCKSYRYYKLPTNTPTNTPTEPEYDAVNSPAHYTSGGIECIDCINAALGENFIGFLIGNVMKYIYRYKDKNGVEDLKKARWYLDRAIKELSNE